MDRVSQPEPLSKAAVFQGHVIAPEDQPACEGAAAAVARDFLLDTVPAHAEIRISALGLYRATLNGQRIGEDYLTPGWTCYDDRIAYQSYDITALLQPGENRIEIWIGDGWYRGRLLWMHNAITDVWGDEIGAIADIVADGAVILSTDKSWQSGRSPVTAQGIYHGEDVDARIDTVTADPVRIVDVAPNWVPHETGAVKALDPIAPVKSWSDAEGRTIHDFGQNAGAIVRLTVKGEAGATICVSHAEVLENDGTFHNMNFRSARAEFHYTLQGAGEEKAEPVFTFMGFRYARVEIIGAAEVQSIEMLPLSSVPDQAGSFTCDIPEVNRLVLNTVWSQRSNFIEVPTDCPQRDERLGWSGDAQVFAGTACWLADSQTFLQKFLRDVRFDQRENGAVAYFTPDPTRRKPFPDGTNWAGSTGWGDCITIIPWQLYLHYGDTAVLRENFAAMQDWLSYLWQISDGPIIRPSAGLGRPGFTFGDWLQPAGDGMKAFATIGDDCAATFYHFISNDIVARVAAILGDVDAAKHYALRTEEIRMAFQREYFSASGRIAHNDQTSWALAFLHDLVPPEHVEAGKVYFRKVIEGNEHLIGTGFIGTPALLPALTKLGLNDLAEKVFLNRRVPGWLYQIERGATTIWERWDAIAADGTIHAPQMNSYNHYAYGAVCQWLFESVAGVAPVADAPGFDRVTLDPAVLPGLGQVSMWHACRHGRIEAAWRIEGETVHYTVTLPDGVEAIAAPKLGGGSYGPGTHEFVFELDGR